MLDTKKESIAVTEANKLGIPVVAVVDTNVDPELVQYPIPGNDDAIRANSLLSRVIADAVEEGRFIASKREPAVAPVTRTAEQEAEFNAQQAAARHEAAAAQLARERRLETAQATGPDEDELTESVAESTDPAAATEPAEPAETAQATQPADPAEASQPADPADATESVTASAGDAASVTPETGEGSAGTDTRRERSEPGLSSATSRTRAQRASKRSRTRAQRARNRGPRCHSPPRTSRLCVERRVPG